MDAWSGLLWNHFFKEQAQTLLGLCNKTTWIGLGTDGGLGYVVSHVDF